MKSPARSENMAETRLALFQAISKSVNTSLILEDIFNALGQVLQQFLPFTHGTIAIFDETQNSIKVIVHLDEAGYADVYGDQVLHTGSDSLLFDLLNKPRPQQMSAPFPHSVMFTQVAKNAIICPLINKGMMIGCIGLAGESYTKEDLDLLSDVSEQLAVALENARLYLQTQSQAGREFLINQITKAIRQSLEIQKILETVSNEVGRVMGVSRCVIHYWGESDSDFQQVAYIMPGTSELSDQKQFADFEKSLFLKRANDKFNPFIINDVHTMSEMPDIIEKAGIDSLAIFPIVLEDTNLVGTISMHQCNVTRSWVEGDIALMTAIAEHVALALYQAQLFQEKENQRKQLEDAINELQQTQMQLIQSEKMAVLGQFVAGIAHEVNNPLGTIVANDDTVKLCLEQIPASEAKSEKLKQSALELLKINQMASERIQEIVRNLRNFARLDESDLKMANLHEGLDVTLTLIHSSIKQHVTVMKEYNEVPLVECFPGLLNQVFMNLLVNAAHSIEGKGTITIRTWQDETTREIKVSIIDTGKGIASEHLSRIFDPGFTTKGVGVGTGLGLALCYKIMEKHHGRIDVTSVVGEGTTMTVVLPDKQTK